MLNNLSKEGLLFDWKKAKGSQSVSTATKKQLFFMPSGFFFIFCLHCTCFSLQAPVSGWKTMVSCSASTKNAPRFHRFLDQIKAPCRDHHLKLLCFSDAITDKHIRILLMVEKSHTSEIWGENPPRKRFITFSLIHIPCLFSRKSHVGIPRWKLQKFTYSNLNRADTRRSAVAQHWSWLQSPAVRRQDTTSLETPSIHLAGSRGTMVESN